MTIQEHGDALLTAYVNKDFERVMSLWTESARLDDQSTAIALHAHKNPSITDSSIGNAVVEAVNATRDYEAEARERNERHDAKRKLWALGYDDYFCEVTGMTYWSQTQSGERITEGDPRKVLESLKK